MRRRRAGIVRALPDQRRAGIVRALCPTSAGQEPRSTRRYGAGTAECPALRRGHYGRRSAGLYASGIAPGIVKPFQLGSPV